MKRAGIVSTLKTHTSESRKYNDKHQKDSKPIQISQRPILEEEKAEYEQMMQEIENSLEVNEIDMKGDLKPDSLPNSKKFNR